MADTVEPRPRRTMLHFTAITWLQVTTNTSVSLCGHIQMFFWTCLPFRLSLTWREAMGVDAVVISHTEKESLLLMLNLIDPNPPNKLFRPWQLEEIPLRLCYDSYEFIIYKHWLSETSYTVTAGQFRVQVNQQASFRNCFNCGK